MGVRKNGNTHNLMHLRLIVIQKDIAIIVTAYSMK